MPEQEPEQEQEQEQAQKTMRVRRMVWVQPLQLEIQDSVTVGIGNTF